MSCGRRPGRPRGQVRETGDDPAEGTRSKGRTEHLVEFRFNV